MPGKWDTGLKQLVEEHPQDFIDWLARGAQLKGNVSHKSPNLNTREIEADILKELVQNGQSFLLHVEFQSSYDKDMALRMWEYNALATFRYRLPTSSVVIYLRKCRVPTPFYVVTLPDGQKVHHFQFRVIKLWEIPAAEIKQLGLVGLYPLMVLAKDGQQPAVVEEIITGLETSDEKTRTELLTMTHTLAAFVFTKTDERVWLKRRFEVARNILHDSWIYQEILQEGREDGLQKGLEDGRLEGQRETLVEVIQARFPHLASQAKKLAAKAEDPAVLRRLIVKLCIVQSEDQAKEALLEASPSKTRKKTPKQESPS